MKPGFHTNISNEAYHASDAVSRSDLCSVRGVPAGALCKRESAAMSLGSAAHVYLLEPHKFDGEVLESENKTTTAKAHQQLVEENPGKIIVTAGTIDAIKKMAKAVFQHPKAAELLGGDFIPEASIFWKDDDTGLMCKSRPDGIILEDKTFFDLKFVREGSADPRKFLWSVRDYGYDLQAAWTTLGMKKATGVTYPDFWFIVCETSEPYRVACYQLDEEWLGDAMYECKRLLDVFGNCRKNNHWPNYAPENEAGETLYRGM